MGRPPTCDTANWTGPVICECLSCEVSKCEITVDTHTRTDTYRCKACGFIAVHSPADEDTPILVVDEGDYKYRTLKTGDKITL